MGVGENDLGSITSVEPDFITQIDVYQDECILTLAAIGSPVRQGLLGYDEASASEAYIDVS